MKQIVPVTGSFMLAFQSLLFYRKGYMSITKLSKTNKLIL